MHGLEATFKDQIDFVHLNVDFQETLAARERFGIVQRSQYVLTDAAGEVLQRWLGFLDEETVTTYIRDYLAAQPA
ncbi:MAG: hypothetical protein JNJ61_25455 [Anaerolineae bacterium]|nr:hypothetical protein [Anaerolineae bacterium]